MKSRLLNGLAIILLIAVCVSCTDRKRDKLKAEIDALVASESTNTPEDKLKLVELYTTYATQFPQDTLSSGFLEHAVLYHQIIGNDTQALSLGRKYLEVYPAKTSRGVYLSMAKSFSKSNQADSAIAYFEWAQNEDALENSDLVQLGDMYYQCVTDKNTAQRDDKMIKAANIRYVTGYVDDADSLFKLVADEYPKSPLAPYALMRRFEIKEATKQIKEAESILRQIIALYPKNNFANDAKIMLEKKMVGKSDEEKYRLITKE